MDPVTVIQSVYSFIGNECDETSTRQITALRLSSVFIDFITVFSESVRTRNITNLQTILTIIESCSYDYDFAFQLGEFGGHLLIKRCDRFDELSAQCEVVIGVILTSGCAYPMQSLVAPDSKDVKKPLEYYLKDPGISESAPINVLLRQIPSAMHGEGQAAVGYIIWSAAVILSRWMHINRDLFATKKTLEIGAGNGLCGIVAASCGASHICITDYSSHAINGQQGAICDPSNVEVCRLDWTVLLDNLPQSKTGVWPGDESDVIQSSSSRYHSLDPPDSDGDKFDVIVASDMVCCDRDADGVVQCILRYMKRDGFAVFTVPREYHRYGISMLLPRLDEVGLNVHKRVVSHSSFKPVQESTDMNTSFDDCSESYNSVRGHVQCDRLDRLYDSSWDDYLAHDLPETTYYQWILLVASFK